MGYWQAAGRTSSLAARSTYWRGRGGAMASSSNPTSNAFDSRVWCGHPVLGGKGSSHARACHPMVASFIRPWVSSPQQTNRGEAVVRAIELRVQSIPVGAPPRRLPAYEVEEKLKAADLVTTILNQAQEAIDFVYETKNKAIAMLHHAPSTEVTVFDLGRCRDHVEVPKSKVDVFCLHKPQHQEFTELLEAAPTKELIAAIEHFRSAIEKLGLHLEPRQGGEGSARSYLLQPFLNEIGSAMSALRKWKIQTGEKVLRIRKSLLEGRRVQ